MQAWNLTSLRWFIDTNTLTDESDAMDSLRDLFRKGLLELARADAMDSELGKRADLLQRSSEYIESFGPAVLGHSRLDHSVLARAEDTEMLDHVFSMLFPNVDRTSARRQHVRDAMHISTAKRYGGTGFITNERRLLNKAEIICRELDGFLLRSPGDALRISMRNVERLRFRQAAHLMSPPRVQPPKRAEVAVDDVTSA